MRMLEQDKGAIYREAAIAKQREDDKIQEMYQLARVEAIGKVKQAMAVSHEEAAEEEAHEEISPSVTPGGRETDQPMFNTVRSLVIPRKKRPRWLV